MYPLGSPPGHARLHTRACAPRPLGSCFTPPARVGARPRYFPGEKRFTIRRELDLYSARRTTRFAAVAPDDECCFLRSADDARGAGQAYQV